MTQSPGLSTPEIYRRLRFGRDLGRWCCLDSGLQSVSETVSFSSDVNHMGVVQQSVKQCCCQHRVTEQLAPTAEILVASQDHASVFVPLGDQTEEQFCLLAVQLRISNLINHQDSRPEIYPPSAFQTALRLSLFQIFNEVRQGVV